MVLESEVSWTITEKLEILNRARELFGSEEVYIDDTAVVRGDVTIAYVWTDVATGDLVFVAS